MDKEQNKANVPKWLIEIMKSYDGMMSTNPDKEHKWIAKRRLTQDLEALITSEKNKLLEELLGEAKTYIIAINQSDGYEVTEMAIPIDSIKKRIEL
jgi:hypothetical protein